MTKKRQRRSAQFKFQVALEALKEQKTLSQLANEYEVAYGRAATVESHSAPCVLDA